MAKSAVLTQNSIPGERFNLAEDIQNNRKFEDYLEKLGEDYIFEGIIKDGPVYDYLIYHCGYFSVKFTREQLEAVHNTSDGTSVILVTKLPHWVSSLHYALSDIEKNTYTVRDIKNIIGI